MLSLFTQHEQRRAERRVEGKSKNDMARLVVMAKSMEPDSLKIVDATECEEIERTDDD